MDLSSSVSRERQGDGGEEPILRNPIPNLNPSHKPGTASTLPSHSTTRLWRPATQRNLRNQWSKLLSSKDRWFSASSEGRSHATAIGNAYLSRRYMPEMDLGVLKDIPGIRQKACEKLLKKQELCQSKLLSSYTDLVQLPAHLFNFAIILKIRMTLEMVVGSQFSHLGQYHILKNLRKRFSRCLH